MSDHGFDGGAAARFLLDLAMDAALLAGALDAQGLGRVVADVALVDIGSLDLDAGQRVGLDEDGSQGMAAIGASMEGLGVEHQLAAGGFGVGGGDRDFAAELVGLMRLAFGDALDLGISVQRH